MQLQHSADCALAQQDDEEQECDRDLFSAIITTKMLGRHSRAEILDQIDPEKVYQCPSCGVLLTRIRKHELDYEAEVESRHRGALLLVNYLREHDCPQVESERK